MERKLSHVYILTTLQNILLTEKQAFLSIYYGTHAWGVKSCQVPQVIFSYICNMVKGNYWNSYYSEKPYPILLRETQRILTANPKLISMNTVKWNCRNSHISEKPYSIHIRNFCESQWRIWDNLVLWFILFIVPKFNSSMFFAAINLRHLFICFLFTGSVFRYFYIPSRRAFSRNITKWDNHGSWLQGSSNW